jgi:hypothetical protein
MAGFLDFFGHANTRPSAPALSLMAAEHCMLPLQGQACAERAFYQRD